ncbi:two-component sensor histidine kinase [Streptomyces oryzae]|uniref:histidine kinase n=1 Tax=Streptomyces oryzae TaxID=1434886 RepID=A0ABS3X9J1_9ACTN|nr:histidine kinase [Streptomyces oryzae]MBO8192057.1 two-component sensor histidine kinase [Streptomyces oryzae]
MTAAAATERIRALRGLRPHQDDVLIALTGLACGLLLWVFDLASNPLWQHGPRWLALVPLGVMAGAALLRRSGQPYALLLGIAAEVADQALGSLLATLVLFTDLLYAAVLYGTQRLARVVLRTSAAVTVLATAGLLLAFQRAEMLLIGAACAGVLLVPTTSGEMIRNHRDKAEAERLRAEQTAYLAELDRKQAVGAERARMARELHDVVANHLSAIAIHSSAALSFPASGDSGEATREALGVIRENSVQGLSEMRRLIGLLRSADGTEEPAATPSLDGLDALLTRAGAMAGDGRTFTLADHRPPGERLPTPVELAAYRVVQEAVTNALKHAAPGNVTVELDRDGARAGTLGIRVSSPLDGAAADGSAPADDGAPRAPGAGAGLVGMRERVELLEGELTAGPVTGADGVRVWQVYAVLPAPHETGAVPAGNGAPHRPGPSTEPSRGRQSRDS